MTNTPPNPPAHLTDHAWQMSYASPPDNLINSFYKPALARSIRYWRAVGYYSSSLISQIVHSLDNFITRGGHIRLIASPANLNEEDLLSFGKGEAQLAEYLRQAYESQIEVDTQTHLSPAQLDRLSLLTWMIANGTMEVKIALREYADYYCLFHEKFGLFSDVAGNRMSFTGSNNETISGAYHNAESFDLQQDWLAETDKARCDRWESRFNAIWEDGIPGITVWTATEWLHNPLRHHFGQRTPDPNIRVEKIASPDEGPVGPTSNSQNSPWSVPPTLEPEIPSDIQLRRYQKDAVNSWLQNNLSGTFAMATGVGKTITALAAATTASRMYLDVRQRLLILVIVPLLDLVSQWYEAACEFRYRPALCHGQISINERRYLDRVFHLAQTSVQPRVEMIITTADSLTPSASTGVQDHFLQSRLNRFHGNLLVIGDEMHSLGTERRLNALPDRSQSNRNISTLGLSATPKRHLDDVGTQALLEYFGDSVASISIKQAIELGALVKYRYIPRFVYLTSSEASDYAILSARIAAAIEAGSETRKDHAIRERSRLIQHAANKLVELRRILNDLEDKRYMIVYAAEGWNRDTVPQRTTVEDEGDLRTITEVVNILRTEYRLRVEPYTGATKKDERQGLQSALADTSVDALVAMRCLDEGVDIPEARTGVIMASTQNPQQFVQRRGRLLRPHMATGKVRANIYDMLVLPPNDTQLTTSDKTLLGNELARAFELAEAAENSEVRYDIRHAAISADLDPAVFPWIIQDEIEMWGNSND